MQQVFKIPAAALLIMSTKQSTKEMCRLGFEVPSISRKYSFRIIHNTRNTERKYSAHYYEEDKTSEIKS